MPHPRLTPAAGCHPGRVGLVLPALLAALALTAGPVPSARAEIHAAPAKAAPKAAAVSAPTPAASAPAARPESESTLRQPFIDVAGSAILGPAATAPAAAHAAPAGGHAESAPAGRTALDPALLQSGASLRNSNLLAGVHPDPNNEIRQQAELLLRLGRRQRLERGYDLAAQNLTRLIESQAPPDLRRAAMLELAVMSVEQQQPQKAQKLYSQFLREFPDDECLPEVCLRQGLLYRQMGAIGLAEAKFFAVITSALTFKKGQLDYYRRLVLQAQTEIADTAYAEGKYEEASDFYGRLLRQEAPELNRPRILYRIIHSLSALGRHSQTVSRADEFLSTHAGSAEEPEVRFLQATALQQLGRKQEALTQVLRLLQSQKAAATARPAQWAQWQQRAGNAIANQMYQEGDFLNALAVYQALADLDPTPAWQLPAQYQVALIQERLQQPAAAAETYRGIVTRGADLGAGTPPALRTVIDMARWRMEFLKWQANADPSGLLNPTNAPAQPPPARAAAAPHAGAAHAIPTPGPASL
jgi:tetratricopeptide (TPR) repeat protein